VARSDYVQLHSDGRAVDTTSPNCDARSPAGAVSASAFPIGIDTELIARQARRRWHARKRAARQPARTPAGDRRGPLDYPRACPSASTASSAIWSATRTSAAADLPADRAGLARRGEYRQLRSHLEQIAGHINGGHAEPDWTPLRYVNRTSPMPR
jgi:trehalose 6-phosphate synthase